MTFDPRFTRHPPKKATESPGRTSVTDTGDDSVLLASYLFCNTDWAQSAWTQQWFVGVGGACCSSSA